MLKVADKLAKSVLIAIALFWSIEKVDGLTFIQNIDYGLGASGTKNENKNREREFEM